MDAFLHDMVGKSDEIKLQFVFWILIFSTFYSFLIALMYRITFKGEAYSQNFAQSIVILGVLVAIVISLIGGSVARAFGVFGALSIIRYRVPIKDPKDLTYVLAAVVIGLACGVGELFEAGVATVFLLILIRVLYDHDLWLGPTRIELPFGFTISPVTAKSRRLNIMPLKTSSTSKSSKKTTSSKSSKKNGSKSKTKSSSDASSSKDADASTKEKDATPETQVSSPEPTTPDATPPESSPEDSHEGDAKPSDG
ncbi:hypothetical protein Pan216_09340 [Planctomycetes bacterium Pan216]|uniref:DUF4956 domain-containing protein n=1 Tax=Kolteria novifilia TaxID=2527975 RepID=A0A518AZC6_9BACT|nr:hypothetical protein Pan216_09340 [Planctomycetes bacterium Pan216]